MKSVLFVDDQQEILDLLKIKLKDKPYRTYFANSCGEALALLEKETIHVVVTDLLMPDANGLTLLQRLKTEYPRVVRIVLSGLNQVTSILAAINNGDIYRYITKPWKIDDEAESIINSALDYSDFLLSRRGEGRFTTEDLQKLLGRVDRKGVLIDGEGAILFGEDEPGGEFIPLSDGSRLKILSSPS
ncbi:MAG: response regulator [Spirochaetales bacterium]|nr:response regulator [Spirochaetales bacterium]